MNSYAQTATFAVPTVKNTAYYMVLRAMTVIVFALLIILAIGLIVLPNKASANTTNSTIYIPVAGLGYYVDANGNPITSGGVTYTCSNNGTCTSRSNTTSGLLNGGSTNSTGTTTPGETSYPYPKYTTPVKVYENTYTNSYTSPYPYAGYLTPVTVYPDPNIGADGNIYLSYPTYGKTPVYGKILTNAYGVGATTGVNSQTTTPNRNTGFQMSGNSTGSRNSGGFIMTNSSF